MNTKDQLRSLIRKIIKEEVREIVSQEVNAVLAEKFVATVGNKQQSLIETVIDGRPFAKNVAPTKPIYQPPQISKEQLRNKLLEKMGAKENPMMAMIYGDDEMLNEVSQAPVRAANGFTAPMSSPQQTANGIIDSDDEGIDISQFYK